VLSLYCIIFFQKSRKNAAHSLKRLRANNGVA
jgi:hypothetical protein